MAINNFLTYFCPEHQNYFEFKDVLLLHGPALTITIMIWVKNWNDAIFSFYVSWHTIVKHSKPWGQGTNSPTTCWPTKIWSNKITEIKIPKRKFISKACYWISQQYICKYFAWKSWKNFSSKMYLVYKSQVFLKMAHSRPLLLYFCLFILLTVDLAISIFFR